MLEDVIHALKLGTDIDRPRERAHADLQLLLQLVEQVERVAALAVHLVDEDDNRSVAHTTHFHELTCLCLHTFCSVDNDDG